MDVSYDQRLVRVAEPLAADPLVDFIGLRWLIDRAEPAADALTAGPAADSPRACGSLYLYTTGQGTTIAFREVARTDAEVVYDSPSGDMSLVGSLDGNRLTWRLERLDGSIAHFDEAGVLSRLEDANGVGLDVVWEPGVDRLEWRPAEVTDAAGRVIHYEYDAHDRLERVFEPVSGLEARYAYNGLGQLIEATRSSGATETYAYDHDVSRQRGLWTAEPALRASCERACAPKSSSCDAGGACDVPVQRARAQCLGSCGNCALDCRLACAAGADVEGSCEQACWDGVVGEPGCNTACDVDCTSGGTHAEIAAQCEGAFDAVGAAACAACAGTCDAPNDSPCRAFGLCWSVVGDSGGTIEGGADTCGGFDPVDIADDVFGLGETLFDLGADALTCVFTLFSDCDFSRALDEWNELCDDTYERCCRDGTDCAPGSCNAGRSCASQCEATFMGWDAGIECLAPATSRDYIDCPDVLVDPRNPPARLTPDWDAAVACVGTVDDYASEQGCVPRLLDACPSQCRGVCMDGCVDECVPLCGDACDDACHVNDCATFCDGLDLMGECQAGCVEGCVDQSHDQAPNGPKYGYPSDLNHNLVEIRDGAGRLTLSNTYGDDLQEPSFDAVIAQHAGEFSADMEYRDLAAEVAGYRPAPTEGPLSTRVDGANAFTTVDICPSSCPDDAGLGVATYVPWSDLVLEFSVSAGTRDGLPIVARDRRTAPLAPTVFETERVDGSVVLQPVTAPRTDAPLARRRFDVQLGLRRVQLRPTGATSYLAQGAGEALDALVALGQVTILADNAGAVRVYPGAPRAAHHVASGRCDRPFAARRANQHGLVVEPASACNGALVVAPLATAVKDPGAKAAIAADPAAALDYDLFRPSALVPVRGAVAWKPMLRPGAFRRDAGASALAAVLDRSAMRHSGAVPMLSRVTAGDGDGRPVFVFHLESATAGIAVDHATAATGEVTPWCSPTAPGAPRRGVGVNAPGPRPAHATVMTDLHGGTWTYYFDGWGRTIRTVNHGTSATESYNYDGDGNLVGAEAADGQRTCLRLDTRGQVTEVIELPAPGALGRTAPIWRRFEYTKTGPVRLAKVFDPRSAPLGGSPTAVLQTYAYDDRGNLVSTTDALGNVTELELVGGTGPSRALPARAIEPSGAVTTFEYDAATGGVTKVAYDATGPDPRTVEMTYDAAGRIVWTKLALGQVVTYDFDGGRLQSMTRDADGRFDHAELVYDATGNVAQVLTDELHTEFVYDVFGHLATLRLIPLDGSAPAQVTCLRHGADGRLLEQVSPQGDRSRIAYDDAGRPVSAWAGSLAAGVVGSWDDACEGSFVGGIAAKGETFYAEYDVAGRPIALRDAAGAIQLRTYDGFGRPIIAVNGLGAQSHTGYDALGHVVWEAAYDAVVSPLYQRPTGVGPGLLAARTQTYDALGRVHQSHAWQFETGDADSLDIATTTYAYDAATRTTSITETVGGTTQLVGDGAGRTVAVVLPSGDQITATYADGGRTVTRSVPTASGIQTSVTRLTPWGAPALVTTTDAGTVQTLGAWSYDHHQRLVSAVDAAGKTTSVLDYDALGRPLVTTTDYSDTSSETLVLSYSPNGWLAERTSDSGTSVATTRYLRDALGRVVLTTRPDGSDSFATYKRASDLVTHTSDAAGRLRHLSYDATGQPTSVRTMTKHGAVIQGRDLHRDDLGRVVEAVRYGELPSWANTTAIRTTLAYDSFGNRTYEHTSTFGDDGAVTHDYSPRSLPEESAIGPVTTARTYDGLGRLNSLWLAGEPMPLVSYAYTGAATQPATRSYVSGVTTAYDYDPLGRLVGLHDGVGASPLADWRWEIPFDGVPRLAALSRLGAPEVATAFETDRGRRLVAEQPGLTGTDVIALAPDATGAAANTHVAAAFGTAPGWRRFELDGRHNWTAVTDAAGVFHPKANVNDVYQYLGDTLATYDATGALLHDSQLSVHYDSFGDVARVTTYDGTAREYVRDAFGRIVLEHDPHPGSTTAYAFDGPHRALRRRPDGDIDVTLRGLGLDDLVARVDAPSGERVFYHQDRQGSVYLVSDSDGAPLEWYDYTAYGDISVFGPDGAPHAASAIDNRFGFQGHPFDIDTGLVDMRARFYRPAWGRFVSPDPIGHAGGANFYAFVDSAPTAWRDPFGLAKQPGGYLSVRLPGMPRTLNKWWYTSKSAPYGAHKRHLAAEWLRQKAGFSPDTTLWEDFTHFAIQNEVYFQGAARISQGFGEFAVGAVLVVGTGGVAGAVIGGFMLVKGVDSAGAGTHTVVTGQEQRSVLQHTVGDEAYVYLDMAATAISFVAGVAQFKYPSARTPPPPKQTSPKKRTIDDIESPSDADLACVWGGCPGRPDISEVPSVRDGEFKRWFNSLTPDEFDRVWANPKLRDKVKARLRHPGGLHEWHLVARANVFKRWKVTAERIEQLRTAISRVKWVNPDGVHGGKGSTTAHNEILGIIDSSLSYDDFVRRLRNWASYRLQGGVEGLPDGF